jgi:hypothetical protein
MCAILFLRLLGATKTGLSSLLACYMANPCGPDSLAAFLRLVYFTKAGTCWYLLHRGNPALVRVPCWSLVRLPPTVDACATSLSTHNCRVLLRPHEPFKRQDF